MKNETRDDGPASDAGWETMHRHLLDDLTPDEFHRLEQDLLSSRETRTRYLQVVRTDVALQEEAGKRAELPAPQPAGRRWLPAAGIAAALALAALAYWQGSRPGRPAVVQDPPPDSRKPFATLLDTRDCRWKTPAAMTPDMRLSSGRIELESGVAIIDFDGGARLALQGPAVLEPLGPKAARLHRGNATVRCEDGLYSFSLLTPNSTIMDLGTEFGVSVEADGTSEVHVLQGEIEIADPVGMEEQGTMFLAAGQTVVLTPDGDTRPLEATTKNWVRDYQTPADRESLGVAPRIFARDVFPTDLSEEKRFALGSGWRGAWWASKRGPKGDLRFVPLEPLVKRDGKTGLALLVGAGVELRRPLAEAIDPAMQRTCYIGFSLHRLNPVLRDKNGKLGEATLMLRSSKDPTSRLGMGLSGRNHWVVTDPGGWERSELPVEGDGPYFVVAKVEFDPRRGKRVSMTGFADIAAVPSSEPAQWDFTTRRRLADTSLPLDAIALQVRHSAFKFGEITLGNSWQAVVDPAAAGR